MAQQSEFSGFGLDDSILNKPLELNAVEQVLIEIAKQIVDDASDNLNKINKYGSSSNASGRLQESITITPVTFMGGVYTIQIKLLEYYKWVDEGRRAGEKPPIDKIRQWIIQKQLRLDDGGTTKKGYKRDGTLISQSKKKVKLGNRKVSILDATAYKIASKIGKFGTKPTNFWTDAIDKNRQMLKDKIQEALKQDVIATFKKNETIKNIVKYK